MAKRKEVKRWVSNTGTEYTEQNVQNIRAAAELIGESFGWDDTREGMEFWSNTVYDRLHEIANDIEKRLGTDGSKL